MPKHSDLEYVSYVGLDSNRAEFTRNKHTYKHSTVHISRDYPVKCATIAFIKNNVHLILLILG